MLSKYPKFQNFGPFLEIKYKNYKICVWPINNALSWSFCKNCIKIGWKIKK